MIVWVKMFDHLLPAHQVFCKQGHKMVAVVVAVTACGLYSVCDSVLFSTN